MSSSHQVPRLLALIPYLQQRPGARVLEVATAFGVTPQQLRRDLEVLWMCGLPGLLPGDLIEIDMDAVDHDGVIHLTNAEYLSRPVVLSATEALTLVVGLQSLRHVAGPDAVPAIDGALAKVRTALGSRGQLADQVVIDVRSAAERIRATLEHALAHHQRLDLAYQRDDLLEPQRRMVDPHSIAVRDGYAYLEAWDCDRQGWRSFRLDRIADAVATSIPAARHGTPPAAAGRSWIEARPDAQRVDLWLSNRARWVTEMYPMHSVEPVTAETAARAEVPFDPDDLAVVVLIAEPQWLTRLLLRLGPAVRVLAPAGQDAEAGRRARIALRMHENLADESGRVEP